MSITDSIYDKKEKSELGEAIITSPVLAIVVKTYNEEVPHKVGITIPILDNENSEIRWAKVLSPYMGKNYGFFKKPEINDQVVVQFLGGKIESPIIVGSISRSNDKIIKSYAEEHNKNKVFQCRNGSYISIEDGADEEGEKDIITVSTAKGGHQVILNNEKKKITLKDKESKCLVEMSTEKGMIKVHAEEKLVIEVGDSIQFKFNGQTGAVSLEAKKLSVKTSNGIDMETDGKAKLSGNQTTVSGTSSLTSECSGMYTINAPTSNFK